MSAAVARVLHRSSSSEYGFMVTKVKICRAPSMKLGPIGSKWLMLRGREGVAPAG